MDEQFWANVKAKRLARGESQEDISKKVGLHQTGYSYFESGKSKRVDPELKEKVALALDATVKELEGSHKVAIDSFPEEIKRWLESDASKEYVADAYAKYISDKIKSLR